MDVLKIRVDSIIHPFLFAVFFIFFLYSLNFFEVSPDKIILPITISILLTIGLLIIIGRILKNNIKAAIIVSLLLIMTFAYSYMSQPLAEYGGAFIHQNPYLSDILNDLLLSAYGEYGIRERYIMPTIVGIFALCIIAIIRTSRKLDNATKIANAISITLIILTVPNFLNSDISVVDETTINDVFLTDNNLKLDFSTKISDNYKNNRDIYYIIPDQYTNAKTLKRVYDFDNTEFISELKTRGFFIPEIAHSNYPTTRSSLTSTLNMGYINNVNQLEENSKDITILKKMTSNNIIMQILKSKGYTTYSFDSGDPLINNIDLVDINKCTNNEYINSPFTYAVLETSIFNSIYLDLFQDIYREKILCALNEIPNIGDETEKPVFVLAHIRSPHEPYVFGPNGEHIKPASLLGGTDKNKHDKKGYIDQIRHINTRILEIIDKLLESENKPIIILQADHGSTITLNWESPDKGGLKERFGILNAYYFPEGGNEVLYDSITPVNNFRSMLNYYFDENYEILEDKSYYVTYKNLYDFKDITEIIREK